MFHVYTMDAFSFFNVDAPHADKVLEAFSGVQFNNRKVELEISNEKRKKFGRKGKKSHRGKGGGKSHRGKGGQRGAKGNHRKGNRPEAKGTGGKRRRRR